MDKYVIQEISGYRSFLDTLCSEDKVLDLGGNIGTMATECALRGAQVMSYEPVPSNVARFQHHISMNGLEEKISLRTELVVEAEYRGVTAVFYETIGPNQGLHTMQPTRGRKVVTYPATTITRALQASKPTRAKVDVEGKEYDLLDALFNCATLQYVIAELHLQGKQRKRARQLMRASKPGWRLVKKPNLKTKAWAALAMWKRM